MSSSSRFIVSKYSLAVRKANHMLRNLWFTHTLNIVSLLPLMLETMFEQEKVQRGVRKGEERGERTFTTGTAEY